MPHISIPVFADGRICELDTVGGWMKVVVDGGGLYTHNFNMGDPNHQAKMDKLKLWFLGHGNRNLKEAVPELTQEEFRMILAGRETSGPS